jgi:hypothetical protein
MTDTLTAPLDGLLAEYGDTIRALLPDYLHALVPFKVEQFGPLTKYTLGQLPDGRWAMLHHITRPDTGPPHDHPVAFEAHIISGGYRETIYYLPPDDNDGLVFAEDIDRRPGSHHFISPDCIHRLTGLPTGDSWSLCFAGPVVRECRHYPELV